MMLVCEEARSSQSQPLDVSHIIWEGLAARPSATSSVPASSSSTVALAGTESEEDVEETIPAAEETDGEAWDEFSA